jgi:hypothetical protein
VKIDQVYRLCQSVLNVEQRGNLPPAQFNLLAEMAQLEYISKRVGNIKIFDQKGVPNHGYESSWRIHEDLRPMVYGPEVIPIAGNGNFVYPYGYIWPDAVHKTDFTPIKRITADQYPHLKRHPITPPTADYPIMIMRGQYGFIDPYSIGSFSMSYLKKPPTPVWGYGNINDKPVFDENLSVDLTITDSAMNEIAMIILQHMGINLSSSEVSAYAASKEMSGT